MPAASSPGRFELSECASGEKAGNLKALHRIGTYRAFTRTQGGCQSDGQSSDDWPDPFCIAVVLYIGANLAEQLASGVEAAAEQDG